MYRVLDINKALFKILIDVLLFNRLLTTRCHILKCKEYINFIVKYISMFYGVYYMYRKIP
jgi:hypothetical protein